MSAFFRSHRCQFTPARLTALVVLLCSSASQANVQISDKLKQNLEIMRDIMQKSLEQQENTADLGRIETSYLAGQGVLFRSQLGGGFGHFFAMSGVPVAPVAPLPPLPDMSAIKAQAAAMAQSAVAGTPIDEDRMQELAEQAEQAAEQMMEQQERLRDQNRELRDQRRDLERELRDVQREKRDLEFSQKVGNKDVKQQERLNELTKQEQQLQTKVTALQQQYAAAEAALQKQRQEQQKLAAQKQTELIARVGYHFATSLCDYGASLRELKENEFISLQLQSRGGRGSSDVYWVLKKSDVNQCVTGKINAEGLLKKASYYRY